MAQENTNPQAEPENPVDQPTSFEVEAKAAAIQAEADDLRNKLIRWQADFQNLQRRSAREVLEARQWAEAEFAKSMLQVLDHFDMALSIDPKQVDAATLLSGVRITYDELKKVLASRGIEAFDATGQPFDPHQHEALMQEENEKFAPKSVTFTFQPGYRMGDRILRPAKVKVNK